MRPWHLGNTTVRSPFRLRDGLIALSASPLQGDLRGTEQEIALRNLLGEQGIVELGEDKSNSVGRKWRSALGKLGFLYPEIPVSAGIPQKEIGVLDMITPNGWRLVRAQNVPAMQECFLRSLAAYYIPSVLEKREYDFAPFSPLRHTLSVMLELEKRTKDSRLNFLEMALVVQLSTSAEPVSDVVDRVLALRKRRELSDKKRKFDQQERNVAAKLHDYEEQTFYDYADTNFRYLKATGLVQNKGRGLSLVPRKRLFIEKLVEDKHIPDSAHSYFVALTEGATLPTDDKVTALAVLDDLISQLRARNIYFDKSHKVLDTAADIAIVRYEAETLISESNEEEYAIRQASEWEEIAEYMDLISSNRSKKTFRDEEISFPKSEAPAYFEWIVWRAFLAINSLKNKPYDARRFKVDQDFLPVGTAPGNGPDLIFEFENFVLVVEVTLTDNSRQEAAEGEPVRRHVAEQVIQHHVKTGKPVYGLFLANRIDSNTAETFRIGVWYTQKDEKLRLGIVPFTLAQFKSLFEALFRCGRIEPHLLLGLFDQCMELRSTHEAPAWKREISQIISEFITTLPPYQ